MRNSIIFFSILFFCNQTIAQVSVPRVLDTRVVDRQVVSNPRSISQTSLQDPNSNTSGEAKKIQTLSEPPKIISSINPIFQIAKAISGDEKNNSLLINPRFLESNYVANTNDIYNLNKSDVIFYISDNLETGLAKVLPSLKNTPQIVQLIKLKNIKLLSFQMRAGEEKIDYNIWLNPDNAITIATNIAETLSNLYPSGAQTYSKNLEQFKIDIKNMDEKNKIGLFAVRPKSFLIDLNRTAYFENYYKIPAAGVIRYTSDSDPTLKDVERINQIIQQEKVVCVLGIFQDKNGLSLQIANNNKTKFALLNIMGTEINYQQNGYAKMMTTLVDDLVQCVKK